MGVVSQLAKVSTLRSMSPEHTRKEMATMLFGSILTMNLFVLLVADNYKTSISNWLLTICSASVVLVSAIILYRQRFKGMYGRTYGAVAVGLILWFVAEIILGGGNNTFQNFGGIANQGPAGVQNQFVNSSGVAAELIWLAGYGFFAYFLFKLMVHFGSSIKPKIMILVGVATAFAALVLAQSIAYYFNNDPLIGSDKVSNLEAGTDLFFKILHPILDMLLIIPALVTMSALKDGKLTSTPWLLLSFAVLILAIQDIGDIYFSILYGINGHWIWKMFETVGYLFIATSLFWYNKFFIFSAKKAMKAWQENNR